MPELSYNTMYRSFNSLTYQGTIDKINYNEQYKTKD